MRVCPNCNREVKDKKADFCPKCGTKLPLEMRINKPTALPLVGAILFVLAPFMFMPTGNISLTIYLLPFTLVGAVLAVKRSYFKALIAFAFIVLVLEFGYFTFASSMGYAISKGVYYDITAFILTTAGSLVMVAARKEFN
jgi:uncharacterized paraquat-inducible protein A